MVLTYGGKVCFNSLLTHEVMPLQSCKIRCMHKTLFTNLVTYGESISPKGAQVSSYIAMQCIAWMIGGVKLGESMVICQILLYKFNNVSCDINCNLKFRPCNIFQSFQIVMCSIQMDHCLWKCLLHKYKPTTMLIQWLKVNYSVLRGFSQINLHSSYLHTVGLTSFIHTHMI